MILHNDHVENTAGMILLNIIDVICNCLAFVPMIMLMINNFLTILEMFACLWKKIQQEKNLDDCNWHFPNIKTLLVFGIICDFIYKNSQEIMSSEIIVQGECQKRINCA